MQFLRDIKSIPVLRPLVALCSGILLYKAVPLSFHILLTISAIALLFLLLLRFAKIRLKPQQAWITGIPVFMFFASFGMLVVQKYYSNMPQTTSFSGDFWYGEVLSEHVLKNGLIRFDIVLYIDNQGNNNAKAQVIIRSEGNYDLPSPGNIIAMKTQPELIPGPQNPGEFDYAAYLKSNGILYRCFVKNNEWEIISRNERLSINLLALKAKKKLWEKIENLEPGHKNLGVLYALSLGSKDMLSPEIKESYSVTGVMHVLVVSGQHIAFIWMVLSYLFTWLKDIRGGKVLQFIIICGLIWFYTFMTGVTASVVRASAMFTLVSLGKLISKESSIYNSLCISAFIGLIINPQWIGDAGFQLSYLAVFSIVFFQDKVAAIWKPKLWINQKIWEVASVSIAAQIGTLPLTLFYFNRFPPWFIISNVIVIPLVTLIMILFIIMLIFWLVPFIFSIFLKIILFLIEIMNISLHFIEMLPSPGMDMIYLSDFQFVCFVIFILGLSMFSAYRENRFFVIGMLAVLGLSISGSIDKYNSLKNNELVLFSVPGRMVLSLTQGTKADFFHNAPDSVDITGNFNFKCKSYILQKGIKMPELISLQNQTSEAKLSHLKNTSNYFCVFGGKRILILNDPFAFKGMNASFPLQTDIIIVNGRIPKIWKQQKFMFQTELLLISTAVPKKYEFEAGKLGFIEADSILDIRKNGAFTLEL